MKKDNFYSCKKCGASFAGTDPDTVRTVGENHLKKCKGVKYV